MLYLCCPLEIYLNLQFTVKLPKMFCFFFFWANKQRFVSAPEGCPAQFNLPRVHSGLSQKSEKKLFTQFRSLHTSDYNLAPQSDVTERKKISHRMSKVKSEVTWTGRFCRSTALRLLQFFTDHKLLVFLTKRFYVLTSVTVTGSINPHQAQKKTPVSRYPVLSHR